MDVVRVPYPEADRLEERDESKRLPDVDAIYGRARSRSGPWGQLRVEERAAHLRQLRFQIMERRDEIAQVISHATGKPVTEALATEVLVVLESIRHLEKHAAKVLAVKRVKTPITLFGKRSYVEYKPRGVVLVIAPWNFPFQLAMIPVIEALVAGNAVVLKPSEVTPAVGDIMQSLFNDANLSNGLVQVVQGGRDVGARLVDAGPDFIHFTGSVRTGREIQTAAAKQLIPTTLELGGKDPMIVFGDANLRRAVQGALWGGYSNSGQVCMSVERVYVERSIFQTFARELVSELTKLRQGEGADADLGTMTIASQLETVKQHVQDALANGARLLYGDDPETWAEGELTIQPTVLTDVRQDMAVMQEETFGPVLPIVPFDTEEEAIALANDTRFGLSASVWTQNIERARRVVSRLISGNACINDVVISIANPNLPYGGVKEGGIGRYHAADGLRTFSVQTSVVIDRGRRMREVNWFPYAGKQGPMSSLIAHRYGERQNWVGFLKAYVTLVQISKRKP